MKTEGTDVTDTSVTTDATDTTDTLVPSNRRHLAVSFDPGMSNFGAAGISICCQTGKITLEFHKTYDIRGERGEPDPHKLSEALESVIAMANLTVENCPLIEYPTLWVIEYQPPLATLANPSLVRHLAFIEGFVISWLKMWGATWTKVSPSAVKKYFKFPKAKSQYRSNKEHAMKMARHLVGTSLNDHISDCVLNAVYGLRGFMEEEEAQAAPQSS